MGHHATGTVRKGRTDKAPLESDVALKKKKEAHSIIELMAKAILSADGMISVVTAASSGACIDPLCLVNCYSPKLKDDPISAAKHVQSV